MHIKDKFVPLDELLELFSVQRSATLKRMLDKNSIPYVVDYANKPLVLRTHIETANTGQYEEEEATFAPLCEQGKGQGSNAPTLSWED